MDKSTTKQLADILAKIDSMKEMEQYMEIPKVKGNFGNFAEYFRSLPDVHKMDSAELIRKSGLERSYFYQVMKGTRNPGRDKVLTHPVTMYAKQVLTVAINQEAGVDEANLLLFKYNEDPLE